MRTLWAGFCVSDDHTVLRQMWIGVPDSFGSPSQACHGPEWQLHPTLQLKGDRARCGPLPPRWDGAAAPGLVPMAVPRRMRPPEGMLVVSDGGRSVGPGLSDARPGAQLAPARPPARPPARARVVSPGPEERPWRRPRVSRSLGLPGSGNGEARPRRRARARGPPSRPLAG